MALPWARRIGNIRTPMPITNAELSNISAAPVTNIAVESLRSPELTIPVVMRLPTPYVRKPARKRTPTIRAAWRTLESGRTAGGEVEWLEAGVPTAIAVFRCDMTAPLREISVPFRREPALRAVQITLGSGGSGHDGVVCTTEGVSTPVGAGLPRARVGRVRTPADRFPRVRVARVRSW